MMTGKINIECIDDLIEIVENSEGLDYKTKIEILEDSKNSFRIIRENILDFNYLNALKQLKYINERIYIGRKFEKLMYYIIDFIEKSELVNKNI